MGQSVGTMQIESSPIILALGANLPSSHGAPRDTLRAVAAELEAAGITVHARSRLYLSPADPPSDQPDYVNAAMIVATALSPTDLLGILHAIEGGYGRERNVANAARALDIDIIDYGGLVRGGGTDGRGRRQPALPHPRAHRRAFVLRPIADIVPRWRHPVSGRSVDDLIAALPPDAARAEPLS